MSIWVKQFAVCTALQLCLSNVSTAEMAAGVDQIGRSATEAELAAWDIDVRPDFQGLPAGSGDAWQGEEIWLEKCAYCHGDFGDSNEVFTPIVLGNITEDDIASGRVADLTNPVVARTTLMKVATVSTLWDYIYRAMPWNAPKSLSPDEVYSLVAYILSLGYIIDEDFELNESTIRDVQERMPNRNGMTLDHGLWTVDGTPDVQGSQCTDDCPVGTHVTSSIPEYARDAHGNLEDQVRSYGPFPGVRTVALDADADSIVSAVPTDEANSAELPPSDALAAGGCMACHQMVGNRVGPGFAEIKAHYAGQDAASHLTSKIRQGGSGVWGVIPMPANPALAEADLQQIVGWLTAD